MVSYDVIICLGNSFQYNKHIVEGGVGQERLQTKGANEEEEEETEHIAPPISSTLVESS